MARRVLDLSPSLKQRGAAQSQFGKQVLPLMMHLTSGYDDGLDDFDRRDLGTVERVSTSLCFVVDHGKIGVDRQARLRMRREPLELRMVLVAARFPAKDCPGQQPLAPQGDEALCVEVFGM